MAYGIPLTQREKRMQKANLGYMNRCRELEESEAQWQNKYEQLLIANELQLKEIIRLRGENG